MAPLWLAVAASAGFVGAVWQAATGILMHIDSMQGFLGDHNRLVREEAERIRARIPRWRVIARRRAQKQLQLDSNIVLSQPEQLLLHRYDQQTWGWSLVIVGAAIACVVAWMDAIGSLVNFFQSID